MKRTIKDVIDIFHNRSLVFLFVQTIGGRNYRYTATSGQVIQGMKNFIHLHENDDSSGAVFIIRGPHELELISFIGPKFKKWNFHSEAYGLPCETIDNLSSYGGVMRQIASLVWNNQERHSYVVGKIYDKYGIEINIDDRDGGIIKTEETDLDRTMVCATDLLASGLVQEYELFTIASNNDTENRVALQIEFA